MLCTGPDSLLDAERRAMIVTVPQQFSQLCQIISGLGAHERFAIDTETTGLRPWGDTQLRGISLYVAGQTFYVPVSHPDSKNIENLEPLRRALSYTRALPIFHNANYDRAILERGIGLKPFERYRDTVLLSWLQDENRPKALKVLGEQMFGIDASEEQRALKLLFKGRNSSDCYKELRANGVPVAEAREQAKLMSATSKRTWADLTAQEIAPYAEQDAKLTNDLYVQLVANREYSVVEPAVQRMHDLQSVVYRMVKTGLRIDRDVIHTQWSAAEQKMTAIQAKFDVNLDSPKQLATLIYETWNLPCKERTEKDAPSTSRAALEALAGMHAGLDEILQYRRLGKAVSTYYIPFLDAADGQNRIHPSVNVVGTVTGRFSYSDPNLQTIPRDGTISGIKDCIVASPGRRLWSYDLRQAELRFMASLAGERVLMATLESGADIYQQVADSIGTTRQVGKSLVLSWPYGVGPIKFSRASGLTVKEARAIIAGFEQAYPNLSACMSKLSQYAEFNGRLPLLEPGRFRRFTSPSLAYPIPSYTALNAACQGGVADTMGNVMIQAEPYWTGMGAQLVLQVHDSLVFEVIPGTEGALGKMLQDILDQVNPLNMPLVWEAKEGL